MRSDDSPGEWPAYAVVRKPLDWLKPYERNARTHGDDQIKQLRGSLRRFGWIVPVLAREDGTIIAGHGRVEAAKQEGLTECPVIVAAGWSEEQCRAYAIADNRIALNSGWDAAILGSELAALDGAGFDLQVLGFGEIELADLMADANGGGQTDPDDVPEPPVKPASRMGDLWLLGRHRLLCGDSTKAEDVAKVLGGVEPHLMVTDPPYGVGYDADWRNSAQRANGEPIGAWAVGKVQNDNRVDWTEAWKLFHGDVAYVWHGALHVASMADQLKSVSFDLRALIVWAKNNFAVSRGHYHWQHETLWYAVREKKTAHWSGDRSQTTLWQIDKPQKSESGHSTQKPVECMKRPIENNSSPGHAVYDPFVGSGTTIIAAEMTSRACIAIDCDPVYVDVVVRRWQEFTGEKATLDGDGRDFDAVAAERVKEAA